MKNYNSYISNGKREKLVMVKTFGKDFRYNEAIKPKSQNLLKINRISNLLLLGISWLIDRIILTIVNFAFITKNTKKD
jgi:hypothetical protein